jgi:hypothetical protein
VSRQCTLNHAIFETVRYTIVPTFYPGPSRSLTQPLPAFARQGPPCRIMSFAEGIKAIPVVRVASCVSLAAPIPIHPRSQSRVTFFVFFHLMFWLCSQGRRAPQCYQCPPPAGGDAANPLTTSIQRQPRFLGLAPVRPSAGGARVSQRSPFIRQETLTMPRHPTPPLSLSLLSLCPSPKQDLAAVPTREGKMRRAAQIGRVLVDEAMGVFKVIPYGIRAMRQHRRLPDARVVLGASDDACAGVSIVRDVRYAAADRAVMDIYLPPGVQLSDEVALGDRIAAAAADAAADADAVTTASCSGGGSSSASARSDAVIRRAGGGEGAGLPVALFVHGGVWAAGEKWQFAPMATRMAEEGVVGTPYKLRIQFTRSLKAAW